APAQVAQYLQRPDLLTLDRRIGDALGEEEELGTSHSAGSAFDGEGALIGLAVLRHAALPCPLGLDEAARRSTDARPRIRAREDFADLVGEGLRIVRREEIAGRAIADQLA